MPCTATLEVMDEAVDLAVIASGAGRIEHEVATAIDCGARSIIVFGAPSAGSRESGWLARLARRVDEAGVPLLGPDSLGLANFAGGAAATWAMPAVPAGGIAVVSQSGTTYWEANTTDPRLGFSLTAHTGMEVSLTLADLMRGALDIPSTRVVGIYVETIRDPDGFVAALELAEEGGVPVVAMFAGRTRRSQAQMTTHAGRLAGGRAAFEALFRHYGVICADTPDEWWATLALLGAQRRCAPGALAAVMDSGGGLALFLDLAEELGVPLAELGEETRERLAGLLGTEDAGNPVDFWAGDADLGGQVAELMATLAADPDAAAVMAFTTYGEAEHAGFAPAVAGACRAAAAHTDKPVLAASYTSRQLFPRLMQDLAAGGIPTLDGMRNALLAVRHAFAHRDHQRDGYLEAARAELDPGLADDWRRGLERAGQLSEIDALALLSRSGIRTTPTRRAADAASAMHAATEVGYPVAVKTDEGITHKAARGGVHLGLATSAAVEEAYRQLATRLGPRVLVAPMLSGVEVALGIVSGQFGPTLMVAAGGVDVELHADRAHLLAPASAAEVRRALDGLRIGRLLRTRFGADSSSLDELCEMASRLSWLGWVLRGVVAELDINPVLVGPGGSVAVDALVAADPAVEQVGPGMIG